MSNTKYLFISIAMLLAIQSKSQNLPPYSESDVAQKRSEIIDEIDSLAKEYTQKVDSLQKIVEYYLPGPLGFEQLFPRSYQYPSFPENESTTNSEGQNAGFASSLVLELRLQVEELKNDTTDLRAIIKALESGTTSRSGELLMLRSQLDSLNSIISNCDSLQTEIGILSREITTLKNEIIRQSSEIRSKNHTIRKQSAKITQQQELIAKKSDSLMILERDVTNKKIAIVKLRNDSSLLATDIGLLKDSLQNERERIGSIFPKINLIANFKKLENIKGPRNVYEMKIDIDSSNIQPVLNYLDQVHLDKSYLEITSIRNEKGRIYSLQPINEDEINKGYFRPLFSKRRKTTSNSINPITSYQYRFIFIDSQQKKIRLKNKQHFVGNFKAIFSKNGTDTQKILESRQILTVNESY